MTRNPILLSLFPIALVAGPVQAQFRDGQPETLPLTPAPRDPGAGVNPSFAPTYKRAGSPRVVVFWNREFDDEVASEYEDRQVEEEVTSGNYRRRDFSSGTKRVGQAGREQLSGETVDWRLQDAFTAALTQSGVRLVDRKMVMRLTGRDAGAGERANVQDLETRGMSRYADILIEVLAAPDSTAPGGAVYRIVVRDLRTARPIGSRTTNAAPPARHLGYVAGAGGFVRETPPPLTPAQIGHQLGLETVQVLSSGLR